MPVECGIPELDTELLHKRGGVISYCGSSINVAIRLIATLACKRLHEKSTILVCNSTFRTKFDEIAMGWVKKTNFNIAQKKQHIYFSEPMYWDIIKGDMMRKRPQPEVLLYATDETASTVSSYEQLQKLQSEIGCHFVAVCPRPIKHELEFLADYIVCVKDQPDSLIKLKSRNGTDSAWTILDEENHLYVPSLKTLPVAEINTRLYDLVHTDMATRTANQPMIDNLLAEWRQRPENSGRKQPGFM